MTIMSGARPPACPSDDQAAESERAFACRQYLHTDPHFTFLSFEDLYAMLRSAEILEVEGNRPRQMKQMPPERESKNEKQRSSHSKSGEEIIGAREARLVRLLRTRRSHSGRSRFGGWPRAPECPKQLIADCCGES